MFDIFDMQAGDYASVDDTTGFDPARLDAHRADQHFAVLDGQERITARCSIWWRDTAAVDHARAGAIGHYSATDFESAGAVLEHACRELKARGCSLALGPLDGNTWRRYRFVTERGSAKPFFLEPDNPDEWPAHFTRSGFAPFADYVSELNTDIRNRQPALGDLRRRFAALGVSVEPLDLDGPAGDLHDIYRVVMRAFANSFLFSPIDFDEFARLYAPLITAIDPQLMLVARHDGRIVGFAFAPPDLLQSDNPTAIDTIVIKTVAVMPESVYRGLGRLLIVSVLENALELGYRQAISALMQRANRSQRISRDCAGPMRGYTLFARALAA